MISRPEIAFQALNTSADSTSAADSARRSDEIGGRRSVGLGQRGVERRQAEEHASAGSARSHRRSRPASAGPAAAARCADREREGDGVAEAVGEEDLRHREADVVGRQLQQVARIGQVRVGHVVLQMHDALGRPVEPDEYIQNAMSSRCVSASGRSAGMPAAIARATRASARRVARRAVDDDQRLQLRVLAGVRIEPRREGGVRDRNRAPESAR